MKNFALLHVCKVDSNIKKLKKALLLLLLYCIVRLGCSSEDCPLVSSQQSMPRQSRLRFSALIDRLIDIIYESVLPTCLK